MSNSVFPFVVLRPYSYPPHHETAVQGLNNGHESRRAELGTYGRYRVRFRTRVPYGSETNETFQAWFRARQGAADSFLFKDRKTALYYVATAITPTGTIGGGNQGFTLPHKHIDAATLVVRRDGTPTGAYVLSLNNTTPTIAYTTAPTSSVGADYEFYMPVRYAEDPAQGEYLGGDNIFGGDEIVELVEVAPGGHRVPA